MLVRHSEKSFGNMKGPVGSFQLDPPLTEFGRELAYKRFQLIKDAGYKFNCIITSPLLRCRETASIAQEVFGCKVLVNPMFGEYFHNHELNESNFHPETLLNYCPRNESYYQLVKRSKAIKIYKNVLYVSHGILIKLIASSNGLEIKYPGYLEGFTMNDN